MSRVGTAPQGEPGRSIPRSRSNSYFMPQGVSPFIATKYGSSRDDVDQYAVCRTTRGKSLERGPLPKIHRAGARHHGITLLDRDETYAAFDRHAVARRAEPSFTMMGSKAVSTRVAVDAHPEVEKVLHIHHAGNSSGDSGWRRRVLIGSAEAGGPWRESRVEKFAPSPNMARNRR